MTSLIEQGHEPLPSYRGVFLVAMMTIVCGAAAFTGWGMYARLDSAVIAQGVMLAESQRKTVESLEGGILRSLTVKAGDRVKEGQVVALLNSTQVEAQLAQLHATQTTLTYEAWRLDAEDRNLDHLDPATAPLEPTEGRAEQVAAQVALFDARLQAHKGQIASLERQIEQLTAQAQGSTSQAEAGERQLAAWRNERESMATLVDKGATARLKLLEYDRNIAAIEGDRDENLRLAQAAREQIAGTEEDIATLRQQRLVEVREKLAEDRRRLAEIAGQIAGARDVQERKKLRAPQAGVVVNISTVTPGAVVGSGKPLMEIIPDQDRLIAQARIAPDTIDTVHVGRKARVRLVAYKRAIAQTVDGTVTYVSADLLEDPRDGSKYFEAKVALDPQEVATLHNARLAAGMPVEIAIQTGERRAGDYMLEPLLRHLGRALREE